MMRMSWRRSAGAGSPWEVSAGPVVSRGPFPPVRFCDFVKCTSGGGGHNLRTHARCHLLFFGAHYPQKMWRLLASGHHPSGDILNTDHPGSLQGAPSWPVLQLLPPVQTFSFPISYSVVPPCPKTCEKCMKKRENWLEQTKKKR